MIQQHAHGACLLAALVCSACEPQSLGEFLPVQSARPHDGGTLESLPPHPSSRLDPQPTSSDGSPPGSDAAVLAPNAPAPSPPDKAAADTNLEPLEDAGAPLDAGRTDAGSSSRLTWEPSPDQWISTIGTSPSLSHETRARWVYVGQLNGHLYRSSEAQHPAPTWERVNVASASDLPWHPHVTAVALAPNQEHEVLVGFAGTTFGPKLYRSLDGVSWLRVVEGIPGEIWGISYNPIAENFVYLMTSAGPVFSNDGGACWQEAPFDDDPLYSSLAPRLETSELLTSVAPEVEPTSVYASTTQGNVFYTDALQVDGEWSDRDPNGVVPENPITRVQVAPSGLVYVTLTEMQQQSIFALDGITWLNLHNSQLPSTQIPVPALAYLGLSINPHAPQHLYLNYTYGAATSRDQGTTWSSSDTPQ